MMQPSEKRCRGDTEVLQLRKRWRRTPRAELGDEVCLLKTGVIGLRAAGNTGGSKPAEPLQRKDVRSIHPHVTVSFIVMNSNKHEVRDFIALMHSIGVDRVKLMSLDGRVQQRGAFVFNYDQEIVSLAELDALGQEAQGAADENGRKVRRLEGLSSAPRILLGTSLYAASRGRASMFSTADHAMLLRALSSQSCPIVRKAMTEGASSAPEVGANRYPEVTQ